MSVEHLMVMMIANNNGRNCPETNDTNDLFGDKDVVLSSCVCVSQFRFISFVFVEKFACGRDKGPMPMQIEFGENPLNRAQHDLCVPVWVAVSLWLGCNTWHTYFN